MMKNKPLRRLFAYLRPYWPGYVFGGGISTLGLSVLQILVIYTLGELVNAAVSGDFLYMLRAVLLCGVGLLIVVVTIPWFNRLTARSIQNAILDIRQELFDHILDLPVSYHEERHSNEIISRLTNDTTKAGSAFDILISVAASVLMLLAFSVYLTFISPWLLLVVLLLGILPLIFNYLAAKPLREINRIAQEKLANLNSRLKDLLNGMPVVRSFGLEKQLSKIYKLANIENLQIRLRLIRLKVVVSTVNNIFATGNSIVILLFTSYLLNRGQVMAGDLLVAIFVGSNIVSTFSTFGQAWATLQSSLASGIRIFEVLDEVAEADEPAAASCESDAAVAFREVSFAYSQQPVLSNISFTVPHGSVVAFVGPSGGGKSTLFKLLLKFYPVAEGQICIDGRCINDYSLAELRGKFAYVSQDVYLYTGTIYENITCVKVTATREEVETAARTAQAHDFIMSLPDGYDTQIGERGTELSGGQRQRIAIARALLKNSPILLLDEATSNLDGESERLVQEALERLMEGRTTLVIAHRLSTIRNADYINVVSEGRIIESDTYEELLTQNGVFLHLHDLQRKDAAYPICLDK